MNKDCFSCNFKDDEKFIVLRTKYWKIAVLDDQAYIGHCVVVSLNHREALAELTKEEWEDFGVLQKKFEPAMKKAFDSPLLNWSCLMNSDFRKKVPMHVHWHVVARIEEPIVVNGVKFEDYNLGYHYDVKLKKLVDKKTKETLADMIRKEIK